MVELARALANTEGVSRVDLLTRQITSPDVDSTYGEPIEMLSCPSDGYGSSCSTAYIIRIPCGPRDKYVPTYCKLNKSSQFLYLTEVDICLLLKIKVYPERIIVALHRGVC